MAEGIIIHARSCLKHFQFSTQIYPTEPNDNLPAFSGGTPYCRWDEGRVMCFLLPKPEDTSEKPRVVNVYGVVVGSVSWNCTYGTCLMQSGRLQSFGCSVMSIADTRMLDPKYLLRCPHDRLNKWFAAKIVDHAALAAEVNEAVQQYLCSIEGTETAIKELFSRDEEYSKHQQALLESEDKPSDGEDISLLKSVGSVVCVKHKKGKHCYGILVEDVLVGSVRMQHMPIGR